MKASKEPFNLDVVFLSDPVNSVYCLVVAGGIPPKKYLLDA